MRHYSFVEKFTHGTVVLACDVENKRISLSIKALLPEEEAAEDAEPAEEIEE